MAKNVNIKKAFTTQDLTMEQIQEIDRCMYGYDNPDTGKHECGPVYFSKNYVRIQHPKKGDLPFLLYPYQEKMMEMYLNNNKVVVLSARQTGKCLTSKTHVTIISPLPNSIINKIKKFILKLLDRVLYDKLYTK